MVFPDPVRSAVTQTTADRVPTGQGNHDAQIQGGRTEDQHTLPAETGEGEANALEHSGVLFL